MIDMANDVCRVCGSTDDLEMIFEKVNAEILQMLQTATPSDIKADECLPKYICIPCIFTLEDFYAFKTLYESTYEKFKKKRMNQILVESAGDSIIQDKNAADELNIKEESENSQDNSDRSGDLNKDECCKYLGKEELKAEENFANTDEVGQLIHEESNNQLTANRKSNLFLTVSGEDYDQHDQSSSEPAACADESTYEPNSESFTTSNLSKVPDKTKLKCNECGKNYYNLYTLKKHQMLHVYPDLYKCEVCDKTFTSSKSLESHSNLHSNQSKHKCGICGKSFTTAHSQRAHVVKHFNRGLFNCDICGKGFSVLRLFEMHKTWHKNPDLFKCDKCPKSFARLEKLEVHKALHSNPDLYKCDECNKTFTEPRYYKLHKNLHVNPSLYKCYICGKTFTQSWSLKKHRAVHLKPTQYKCEECGKVFNKSSAMKLHQRHKHYTTLATR